MEKYPIAKEANRHKVISISQQEMLDFMSICFKNENMDPEDTDELPTISIPSFKKIPMGAIVNDCYYDDKSKSYFFIIQHPSFDVVAAGSMIPLMDSETKIIELEINNNKKTININKPNELISDQKKDVQPETEDKLRGFIDQLRSQEPFSNARLYMQNYDINVDVEGVPYFTIGGLVSYD